MAKIVKDGEHYHLLIGGGGEEQMSRLCMIELADELREAAGKQKASVLERALWMACERVGQLTDHDTDVALAAYMTKAENDLRIEQQAKEEIDE